MMGQTKRSSKSSLYLYYANTQLMPYNNPYESMKSPFFRDNDTAWANSNRLSQNQQESCLNTYYNEVVEGGEKE